MIFVICIQPKNNMLSSFFAFAFSQLSETTWDTVCRDNLFFRLFFVVVVAVAVAVVVSVLVMVDRALLGDTIFTNTGRDLATEVPWSNSNLLFALSTAWRCLLLLISSWQNPTFNSAPFSAIFSVATAHIWLSNINAQNCSSLYLLLVIITCCFIHLFGARKGWIFYLNSSTRHTKRRLLLQLIRNFVPGTCLY